MDVKLPQGWSSNHTGQMPLTPSTVTLIKAVARARKVIKIYDGFDVAGQFLANDAAGISDLPDELTETLDEIIKQNPEHKDKIQELILEGALEGKRSVLGDDEKLDEFDDEYEDKED